MTLTGPARSLRTERLLLRQWREDDFEPFAAINADPIAMEHMPALLTRTESDALAHRIHAALEEHPFGLWAVEVVEPAGAREFGTSPPSPERGEGWGEGKRPMKFIGFVGLSIPRFEAHFTPCVEVGWRLMRASWGHGYATEAAREAIRHGFEDVGLSEIVSMTTPANLRSRRVMERLGMTRDPVDDFDHPRIPEGHPIRRHVLYRIAAPARR